MTFEPVFEKTNNLDSDQVRHKPTCSVIEDGLKLEILDLDSKGIVLSLKRNKGADQLTPKLICVFVFAYADCWFSHAAAHF